RHSAQWSILQLEKDPDGLDQSQDYACQTSRALERMRPYCCLAALRVQTIENKCWKSGHYRTPYRLASNILRFVLDLGLALLPNGAVVRVPHSNRELRRQ